jgi:uncharacterized RDD family membrane protein YckC
MARPDPRLGTEDDVLGDRILAFLLDQLVVLVLAVLFGLAVGGALQSRAGVFLGVLLVVFSYHFVCEGLWGQTPGKRALDVVVVDEYGQHIDLGTSFVRNLFRGFDGLFYWVVGLVAMLLSDRNQRLCDSAAGTVVVRTEGSLR